MRRVPPFILVIVVVATACSQATSETRDTEQETNRAASPEVTTAPTTASTTTTTASASTYFPDLSQEEAVSLLEEHCPMPELDFSIDGESDLEDIGAWHDCSWTFMLRRSALPEAYIAWCARNPDDYWSASGSLFGLAGGPTRGTVSELDDWARPCVAAFELR